MENSVILLTVLGGLAINVVANILIYKSFSHNFDSRIFAALEAYDEAIAEELEKEEKSA